MLVVPADGALALAQFLATGRQLLPYVGLFVNNVIPDDSTTLADLVEASFPGYTRNYLGPAVSVTGQSDGSALMLWNPAVWTNTLAMPSQTAYGYFVVQLDSSLVLRLLWLERVSPSVDWSVYPTSLSLNVQLADQTLFG